MAGLLKNYIQKPRYCEGSQSPKNQTWM